MSRIQVLYDQIEPLWLRLEIEQDQQDLFMDMNTGCSEAVIRAVSRKPRNIANPSTKLSLNGVWNYVDQACHLLSSLQGEKLNCCGQNL